MADDTPIAKERRVSRTQRVLDVLLPDWLFTRLLDTIEIVITAVIIAIVVYFVTGY